MRVLIVDDREDNRYLLRMLMPVMDGYTLLREWKADAALHGIPFMVYTATYTEAKDAKLALDMGADAFLVKPAEPEVFIERVHAMLAKAAQQPADVRTPVVSGASMLKMYNEVLVHKLEQRSLELEQRLLELDAAHQQILRLNRLYAALSETNQAIVHTRNREELLERLCTIAVERGGLRMAWVCLLNPQTGEVVPAARCGVAPDWFVRLAPIGTQGPPRVPAELALSLGKPYICNDLLADPRLRLIHADLLQNGFLSGACFFFTVDDEEGLNLLTEMVSDVCFALSNFEKEARRRQAEERLRVSEEAIRLNSSAVEASANGIVIFAHTAQGWGIIHANPAFERITGYSLQEATGQSPDLLVQTDREQMGRSGLCPV